MKEGKDEAEQVGQHDAYSGSDHYLHEHWGRTKDVGLEEEEHTGKGAESEHHCL